MKVVILAGGYGTRLSEETDLRPKPMVEVGHRPILWHIMKLYSAYGHDEFVVCCGYKGEYIKDWFVNYRLRQSDVTVDLGSRGRVQRVHTAARARRCSGDAIRPYLAARHTGLGCGRASRVGDRRER